VFAGRSPGARRALAGRSQRLKNVYLGYAMIKKFVFFSSATSLIFISSGSSLLLVFKTPFWIRCIILSEGSLFEF
jgi:hypothetical protein